MNNFELNMLTPCTFCSCFKGDLTLEIYYTIPKIYPKFTEYSEAHV